MPLAASINLTTTFVYNPSGTIASVTDANNHTTSFGYDASDQKITMTYPNNGGTQQWAWDGVHNPKWRITVNTQTFEAKYFLLRQLTAQCATWWYEWVATLRPDWRYRLRRRQPADDGKQLQEAGGAASSPAFIASMTHDHLTLEGSKM